uniref:Uncharacterized protein n=1 Tax=Anguilla anguilla TaxID=7936 RepID=A0A0E9PBV8_ANGAN
MFFLFYFIFKNRYCVSK